MKMKIGYEGESIICDIIDNLPSVEMFFDTDELHQCFTLFTHVLLRALKEAEAECAAWELEQEELNKNRVTVSRQLVIDKPLTPLELAERLKTGAWITEIIGG